jgi:hypothetical protein
MSLTYIHAYCIYTEYAMIPLSTEKSMYFQKQTKILHDTTNKVCSLLTPYSAVQGTGCNVA